MPNPNTPDSREELPDELQALWQSGRTSTTTNPSAEDAVVMRAHLRQLVRQPQRVSLQQQVATVLILAATAVILALFFRYASPLTDPLSAWGRGLMIGSLLGRIAVEIIGIGLGRRISLFDSAAAFARASRRYVRFRYRVHRYAVIATLALYSLGYYLLMPEYARYFSTQLLWLLIVSYAVIMGLVVWLAIRPGMARERAALAELERVVAQGDAES